MHDEDRFVSLLGELFLERLEQLDQADVGKALLVIENVFFRESGRFPGVRFRTAPVGLGKLFACLKLRYRPLQSINFA